MISLPSKDSIVKNTSKNCPKQLTIEMPKYKPYLRPKWTPQVKSLHNTERRLRKLWISEGRPRGMEHETTKTTNKRKGTQRA